MKRIIITLVLFVLFINVGYAANGTAYCPDDNEPVNIRNSAGGSLIGNGIPCDSEVEVLDTNGGSTDNCRTWYKVRYDITTGYACSDYIKLNGSSTTYKGKALCIENTDPLNIWSDINKSSKLDKLSCNEEMEILEKNVASNTKCGNWYKVRHNGTVGYACGKYIGDVNSSTPVKDIGKGSGDNIYRKDNYNSKPSGDGTISCFEDTLDLSLRKTPGGSTTGKKVSCGEVVTINSDKESSGICPYYYNITDSKGNSGYVCSYYVNTTSLSSKAKEYYKSNSLDDYYNSLRSSSFPDSYLPYLAELHARHPNWKFVSESIPLTFDEVVDGENAYGRNLLQGSAFSENYYSMGINNYDILSNEFKSHATEGGWYDASSEAVAYYLDPRNYLNIKYIIAYELLNYNSNHTEDGVKKIMGNNSYWNSIYSGYSGNAYSDVFNATKDIGISSFHIAARIKQEISGIEISDPRSGGSFTLDGTNYSNYYNFFNIKVYGINKVLNGMRYAVENGWNTPYRGIYGGSKFIYDEYCGVNQDTLYYEKFDVSTSDGNYSHQYMQNLAVIAQETNRIYKSYVENVSDYFDKPLEFTIPVYKDMPNYAVTAPRIGNPNNYLSDLRVNGSTVSGFSYDTYSYEVNVPYGTSSVNISASKIASSSSVSGIGDISIDTNEKKISVIVTSESGNSREYVINIKRDEIDNPDDIPSLDTILNNSGIKYNNGYIFGIGEGTSVSSLIDNIKKVSSYARVNIKNSKGNNKTSGSFVTGDVVVIGNGKEEKSFSIVIYGDVNGDGVINKLDAANILSHYYSYISLTGVYKVAADVNKNGEINKLDAASILSHYYGYVRISQ